MGPVHFSPFIAPALGLHVSRGGVYDNGYRLGLVALTAFGPGLLGFEVENKRAFGCSPNGHCTNHCIPALFRYLCHENVTRMAEKRTLREAPASCHALPPEVCLELAESPLLDPSSRAKGWAVR
jgi:hypothetical protein